MHAFADALSAPRDTRTPAITTAMCPAQSIATTAIQSATCSNRPINKGCELLSSDANSHWLNADKPHYVKLEYRILQQIGARNSALGNLVAEVPPPLVAELLG